MYLKGTATSLLDMMEQFLTFAQTSDSKTQAWELVDNRLDSFFGATLKIPMKLWTKNSETPHFYISFQHSSIDKNTYSNWLRGGTSFTPENYTVRGIEDGSYLYPEYPIYPLSELYNHSLYNRIYEGIYNHTKYGTINYENPFKNTGEFVAVSCHTHFNKNLMMCEQGGVTCRNETLRQFNNLNLLPIYYEAIKRDKTNATVSNVDTGNKTFPAFPGTGCPWFVLADENREEYNIKTDSDGFTFWFTKSDYSATITLRLNSCGVQPDIYQSMSFGMMENTDKQSYLFPLFVAGGSQGISQDIWVHNHYDVNNPIYNAGNSYDLDARNICLSNSNLLHPTKFNGSSVSNFRVLSPGGEWRDVFAHLQTASVVKYYSCKTIYDWGYPLNSPTSIGYNYHLATPSLGEVVKYTTDTYDVNGSLVQNKYDTPFQRIIVALNNNLDSNDNGIVGIVPNAYMSWSRTMPCGEIEIDGENWLSIPNGWENRMWHYPTRVGAIINNEWQNKTIRDTYDRITSAYSDYIMRDRLLIKLE